MESRQHLAIIPNSFTAGNLVCGFLAILLAMRQALAQPGVAIPQGLEPCTWLILAATLCDLLDGWLARKLGVAGSFGMKLDSFADSVTFGLAPAMLLGCSLLAGPQLPHKLGWLACAAYYFGAVVRLARYNLGAPAGHHFGFEGLPSPAAALLLVFGFMAARAYPGGFQPWMPALAAVLALAAGVLMVTAIPFVALKGLSPHERLAFGALAAFFLCLAPWLGLWQAAFLFLAFYVSLFGWAWVPLRRHIFKDIQD
jgi:CDP-diacylglycerol--serine O-phosphatidyltransferase